MSLLVMSVCLYNIIGLSRVLRAHKIRLTLLFYLILLFILFLFLFFFQFGALRGLIPTQCILKADQWVLLSRTHAQAVLTLPSRVDGNVLDLFKNVRTPQHPPVQLSAKIK